MSLLDFLRPRPKNTANIARERLRIIVAQERATRDGPDYLPLRFVEAPTRGFFKRMFGT